jgi:hypothetical protein
MNTDTITIPKAVDPGIKKHWVDGYKELDPMLEKIFKVGTQESETDEEQNYTGLGDYAVVSQGGTFDEDAPLQSYGTSYTPVKWGKLMKVTYEMRKWAKVSKIYDASRMQGRVAARKIQKVSSSVFKNGFNTSYTSYSDAKPLFSTLHPRADGGTAQSNASATGIVFSEPNLETGFLALENQLDDRGEIFDVTASRIIIPNALRKSALAVVRSEQKSGTGNNDKNAYAMEEYAGIFDILVWKYLGAAAGGSDTAWYLEDPSSSRLEWNWAEKPTTEYDASIGFKQDIWYWKGRMYASYGWSDWRAFWGSKGDAQAYSS